MITIAQTEQYELFVDEAKNRIYLKVVGFWKDLALVPVFLNDIKKASQKVTKGFTVLVDLTTAMVPPQDIGRANKEAQKILASAGAGKIADFRPEKGGIVELAGSMYAYETGVTRRYFVDKDEAEAWLDEKNEK